MVSVGSVGSASVRVCGDVSLRAVSAGLHDRCGHSRDHLSTQIHVWSFTQTIQWTPAAAACEYSWFNLTTQTENSMQSF